MDAASLRSAGGGVPVSVDHLGRELRADVGPVAQLVDLPANPSTGSESDTDGDAVRADAEATVHVQAAERESGPSWSESWVDERKSVPLLRVLGAVGAAAAAFALLAWLPQLLLP